QEPEPAGGGRNRFPAQRDGDRAPRVRGGTDDHGGHARGPGGRHPACPATGGCAPHALAVPGAPALSGPDSRRTVRAWNPPRSQCRMRRVCGAQLRLLPTRTTFMKRVRALPQRITATILAACMLMATATVALAAKPADSIPAAKLVQPA